MAMDGKQKTLLQTVGVVVTHGRAGLGLGSVFTTGSAASPALGGVTQEARADSDVILDRTIKVRFDASKARGFAWEFKPMQREMELRIGETGLAFYEAYNPTDRPIAGQASYNVTPYEAGGFFSKIDCFCFTEQVLQPGERVEMPVTFFVDPEIVDEPRCEICPHHHAGLYILRNRPARNGRPERTGRARRSSRSRAT